jgi:adenosylcobinamide amidohydrolase
MMLYRTDDGFEIHREDKLLYVRFLAPHRVISTCRAAGGVREDLNIILNHQSCEPSNHHSESLNRAWSDPEGYRRFVCARNGLPPESCATLGTAANMNHAAVVEERCRDLIVTAVTTGGVETNAGRVGDRASVYEMDGKFTSLALPEPPVAGTINTILIINKELTVEAMVRSIVTATEAKTAALQELAVNSRYSSGLATGTGTDQFAAACRLGTGIPLTSAGKHAKLGELIGLAVGRSVKTALARQNQLTPSGQCSVRIHLERFRSTPGQMKRGEMVEGIARYLSGPESSLLRDNYDVVDTDPFTVTAAACMAHVMDKLTWGVLPESCRLEILTAQAAVLAAAVSGRFEKNPAYRDNLADRFASHDEYTVVDLAQYAMALGFKDKWAHLDGPAIAKE